MGAKVPKPSSPGVLVPAGWGWGSGVGGEAGMERPDLARARTRGGGNLKSNVSKSDPFLV